MLIGIGGQNIIEMGKYDMWLSIVIGFVIGLIPISLIAYLNKKDLNIFDLISKSFNRVIGKILKIVIILVLLFILVTLTNDFVNFANVKYLFETSNLVITLLFIIPSLFICHKGIETIGRTGIVLFIINMVIFVINVTALFKNVDINNLKPFLNDGIAPVLKGSLYYIIYAVVPIFFIGIIPKNKDIPVKKYNKSLYLGYIVSAFSILTVTFFVTTIYNFEYIKLFSYPAYYTLKKITYGFIQNVENILSFYFIIDYFLSMTVMLYSIFYFLGKELKLKQNKLKIGILIITLLVIYLSNYLYKNTTLAILSSKTTYIIITGIFLVLFVFILPILIKLKNKGNN